MNERHIVVTARVGDGRFDLHIVGHDQPAAQGRVCAAVSAVSQTALLGLEEIARQHPDHVTYTIEEIDP